MLSSSSSNQEKEEEKENEEEALENSLVEKLQSQLNLSKTSSSSSISNEKLARTLDLLKDPSKKVIVLLGAGISVNAGIPDFRTPGTGLYSQMKDRGLPYPEAVFSIEFFKKNPGNFCLVHFSK